MLLLDIYSYRNLYLYDSIGGCVWCDAVFSHLRLSVWRLYCVHTVLPGAYWQLAGLSRDSRALLRFLVHMVVHTHTHTRSHIAHTHFLPKAKPVYVRPSAIGWGLGLGQLPDFYHFSALAGRCQLLPF